MSQEPIKMLGLRATHRYAAGLDVHKYYVTACVAVLRDQQVEKVALQEFRNDPKGLQDLCHFLGKYILEAVVMEATGANTPPVKKMLDDFRGWGVMKPAVIVINPSLVRKYPGERHADKSDALDLARLGLLGLTRASHLPTGEARQLRGLTREMDFITRDSTRLKNRIKRVLAEWGLTLPDLDLDAGWAIDLFRAIDRAAGNFGRALADIASGTIATPSSTRRALVNRAARYTPFGEVSLPGPALAVLRGYLLTLSFHAGVIERLAGEVEILAARSPAAGHAIQRIAGIDGIDERSAAGIVAEVGDVRRFPCVRKFLQYAGCSTAPYDSGETHRRGHLTKRANPFLKRRFFLAGKAVCHTVKADSDLKEYSRAMLNRHPGKKGRKLAWANVGIKIARVVYSLLKEEREFEAFHEVAPVKPDTPDTNPANTALVEARVVPPVQMRTLRARTRRYTRYVKEVFGSEAKEWYNELASFFSQLAGQQQK